MFGPVDPALQSFWEDVGYLGNRGEPGANVLYAATVRNLRQRFKDERDNGWQKINETIRGLIGNLELQVVDPVSLTEITDFDADLVCSLLNFPRANFRKYWPLIAAELKVRKIHTKPLLIGLWCNIMRESGRFLPIQGLGGVGVDVGYGPRGFIQLYGRENYRNYTKVIQRDPRFQNVDLFNDPDQALRPDVAAWITAEFIQRWNMPRVADAAYQARTNEDLWRKVRAIIFRPAYVSNNSPQLRAEIDGEGHFGGFYSGVRALLANEARVFR